MKDLKGRSVDEDVYIERLNFELSVILEMDYSGYFLIVSDFIRWAKEKGIPVGPGRGSGAGSLVAWALSITNVDPIEHELLFERFLNPERVSMPDFDIDFCADRRDEVIAVCCQKVWFGKSLTDYYLWHDGSKRGGQRCRASIGSSLWLQ